MDRFTSLKIYADPRGFELVVAAVDTHFAGQRIVFPSREELARWILTEMPLAKFETKGEADADVPI